MSLAETCPGAARRPSRPARVSPEFGDLRDLLHEMAAMGLFEVSSGARVLEHMLDRVEHRP